MEYAARTDRLSERERLQLLGVLSGSDRPRVHRTARASIRRSGRARGAAARRPAPGMIVHIDTSALIDALTGPRRSLPRPDQHRRRWSPRRHLEHRVVRVAPWASDARGADGARGPAAARKRRALHRRGRQPGGRPVWQGLETARPRDRSGDCRLCARPGRRSVDAQRRATFGTSRTAPALHAALGKPRARPQGKLRDSWRRNVPGKGVPRFRHQRRRWRPRATRAHRDRRRRARAIVASGAWWWLRTPAFAIDVNADRNVLLVTIDTLRADALGSYGGRATTPNLDRLAAARRALHFRARARGRHAALARVDPDRPVPVRARHPRQHGLSSRADAGDGRDAAEGAGLRHGRVRRRLPARSPIRPRRRIRCL